MKHLPIICTLSPEALAARKANLLSVLVQRATVREDAADTLRFRFPAEELTQ